MTLPWQTVEWKNNAKAKLLAQKDKYGFNFCEQCKTQDFVPVMQHFNHNEKTRERAIRSVLVLICYLNREPSPYCLLGKLFKTVLLCPKCGRDNIATRKTMFPVHKCYQCRYEFDTPALDFKDILSPESTKWRIHLEKKYSSLIEKEDVELSKRALKRYISLIDAKIFCQKCTAMWDLQHKKLCSVCKNEYHPLLYRCCLACLRKEDSDLEKELSNLDKEIVEKSSQ